MTDRLLIFAYLRRLAVRLDSLTYAIQTE
jgi:hypothetical protein